MLLLLLLLSLERTEKYLGWKVDTKIKIVKHPTFLLQRTFDHERRRQIRTPLGRVFVRIFLGRLQQVRLRGFVPGPLLSQLVGIHPGRGGWLHGALLQGVDQLET